MCFQGQSTATIRNPTIPDADASGKRPDWVDTGDQATIEKARADLAARKAQQGIPEDAPDFTDELLEAARKRMAGQLMTKSSRRSALAANPGRPNATNYSLLGS